MSPKFFQWLLQTVPLVLDFPGGASGKESRGGHGNPLQYSCLENPQGQRSLGGYSPWGHKESDMTKVTCHTHAL